MEENMEKSSVRDHLNVMAPLNSPIFPHKFCRSCLCVVNKDSFWMEGFYFGRKLVDIFRDLMSLEIELNERLPSKLCPTCYDHIIKFDAFKNKVVESEKLLADKLFVIEKSEIDCDEQDLDHSQEDDCETEPVVKIDPENENTSTEDLHFLIEDEHCEASDVLPMRKRKRRISRKIFKRKPSDGASVGRLKRGRRKESCTVCGKVMFPYKMGSHMRTHTKEKPFGCEKCGASFADKSNLNRHLKTHESYRPYSCEICGKGFLRPSSKALHEMTKHASEKNVLCPICGKAFKHECFLKKHMANIHNKPEAEVKVKVEGLAYECPICGQFYRTKSSLSVHKMRHEQPRGFLCNICGRTYSTKAVLDNHQKVHTGEKNLVCNVCNKTFRYKSTLNTHVLVHSGEKPLSCHICNKQFRQHAHLNTHIKGQHSTNRPYQCSFCSKTFKQSCNLTVHTRIHTGETPYHCDVCQKGFYDSSSLKKHQKSHTGKGAPAVSWDKIDVDVSRLEKDTV